MIAVTWWANQNHIPLVIRDCTERSEIITWPEKRMMQAIRVVPSSSVETVAVVIVDVSNVEGRRRDVNKLLGRCICVASRECQTVRSILLPPLPEIVQTQSLGGAVDLLSGRIVSELQIRIADGIERGHSGIDLLRA